MANVLDVNAGRVDSGLAQSDIVADAVAGKGEFRTLGPQSRIRVIANLFPEEVHLVAARAAHIKRLPISKENVLRWDPPDRVRPRRHERSLTPTVFPNRA